MSESRDIFFDWLEDNSKKPKQPSSILTMCKIIIDGVEYFPDFTRFEFKLTTPDGVYHLSGTFTYNDIEMRYEIDIDKKHSNSGFVCLYYDSTTMSEFKIIKLESLTNKKHVCAMDSVDEKMDSIV